VVTTGVTIALGRPAPRLAPPAVLADASSIDCAREVAPATLLARPIIDRTFSGDP
jgi:hypothetical protein